MAEKRLSGGVFLAGSWRCAEPKNPTPGVTTYFCVYPFAHGGAHSWEETTEARKAEAEA